MSCDSLGYGTVFAVDVLDVFLADVALARVTSARDDARRPRPEDFVLAAMHPR
ncbi:hypothetical protein [Okibacterium endophyticum]